MKEYKEYLSDEELNCLIAEVEQSDLIPAPPDLAERILDAAGKNKVREFRRYCIRVWTSVAAAIVLTFLLPRLLSLIPVQNEQLELSRNEKVLLTESRWTPKFETKEEALSETGFLEQLLGGNNIFGKKDIFQQSEEGKGGNDL